MPGRKEKANSHCFSMFYLVSFQFRKYFHFDLENILKDLSKYFQFLFAIVKLLGCLLYQWLSTKKFSLNLKKSILQLNQLKWITFFLFTWLFWVQVWDSQWLGGPSLKVLTNVRMGPRGLYYGPIMYGTGKWTFREKLVSCIMSVTNTLAHYEICKLRARNVFLAQALGLVDQSIIILQN